MIAFSTAPEARAANLLDARLQGGEDNLILGAVDYARPVATGVVATAGLTTYSDDRLNATVAALRAGLARSTRWRSLSARLLSVPKVEESEAHGGMVTAVFITPTLDPDYRQTASLSAGWVRHDLKVLPAGAPKSTKRHAVLGQGVAEASFRQSYYRDFHFTMTGAAFYYDRDLAAFRGATTVLPQSELSTLGTFSPVAGLLPDWSAGVQYTRPAGDTSADVTFGWTRTAFHERGLWLNSWMVGVRVPFTDAVSADFGWNGVEGRRGGFQQFFGTHLSCYWR